VATSATHVERVVHFCRERANDWLTNQRAELRTTMDFGVRTRENVSHNADQCGTIRDHETEDKIMSIFEGDKY